MSMRLLTLLKRTALILTLLLCVSSLANAQLATGNITTGGTDCTTATNCVTMAVQQNTNTIRFTITGTWTGTLQFQWAGAGAVTTETNGLGVVNINPASFAQASSTTANGSFVAVNNNFTHVMVRASTLGSGTAVVRIQGSSNGSTTGIIFGSGSGGTIGTVNQGTASLTENWRVNCVSGCGGGTTDTDDGSIATGQTGAIALDLAQVYDGSVWRRFTIGTAGSPSTQVISVQGVASGTSFNVQPGGTWSTGNGISGSGVPRVTIASDSTGTIAATQSGTWNIGTVTAVTAISNALPAGSNVIGHVINDTGSTTAVTGNVTVVQGTGTNLHAVIDSGSTTAVTGNVTVVQGTGSNLHAVLDSGTTTVTQGTGSNLHMVCDSGCTATSLPADNSAFTAGSTGSSPVSGFYHSTRDTLTDGRIGAIALTSKRAQYSSLETPLGDSAMDDTLDAVKVTNSTASTATSYLTMRLSDGTNFPALSADQTIDSAIGTTGPLSICRGSTATPSAVSADNDAQALWCDLNGRLNVTGTVAVTATNLSTNIAQMNGVTVTMGNGASGTGVQRVTIANDSTGTITATQATGTNLHMVCDSGCSSSTAPADNSAFTAGSTSTSPVAGFYHSTRDTVTDGRLANFAITSKRALYTSPETPNGDSMADETNDALKVVNATAANFNATVTATNLSTNISQINGVTPLMGNGVTGTGSPRVTLASDTTSNTNPLYTSPIGTSTTAAASGCYLISAASTNATVCKASAGNLYGIRFLNTTTTIYYLRLYNLSSAPTCSSATGFIESIPIPPASASGQTGGIVEISDIPINYSTGIGFCFTGGSGSTDNSNAATGVFGKLVYK